MEDLTKNQLVLLTLLISFVTSIATGIITFSLLQEAPPFVTQTINRVVEKTIETVVSENKDNTISEVREVTIVVKEEDRIIDAISKNTNSSVKIQDVSGLVYGVGTIISPSGLIVSSTRDIFNENGRYKATMSDKTEIGLRHLGQSSDKTAVFFKVVTEKDVAFNGVSVDLSSTEVKLGQSVITLEGESHSTVSIGRVSAFLYSDPADTTTKYGLETDIIHKYLVVGSPLFNLSGELVGIRSSRVTASNSLAYISVASLQADITEYLTR